MEKTKKKAPRKPATKLCFKCGKPVSELDTKCPHCGATGEQAPVWIFKVLLGVLLGFLLGLIYWNL